MKDEEYPDLWILGTTVSPEVTEELLAKKGWPVGVNFSPGIFKVAIVAINQLPANAETLWLRMLGKGGVQKRAFNEVKELPEESSFSKNVLDVVQKWYSALHGKEEKTPEEQELIMELATSFAEWEQATLQRGQVQMQRQFIENFLMARFGAIDEALAGAIESLLKMSMAEVTGLMLELSSLEKEEFLARLENHPETRSDS